MDITIRKEIGRCHTCGYEFVILSRRVEHPDSVLTIHEVPQCPHCGSDSIVHFGVKFFTVKDDKEEAQLNHYLLHDIVCAGCGRELSLLSSERTDLVFTMREVINKADELVKEWQEAVPFCKQCRSHNSHDKLVTLCHRFFQKEDKEYSEDILMNAKYFWKD